MVIEIDRKDVRFGSHVNTVYLKIDGISSIDRTLPFYIELY